MIALLLACADPGPTKPRPDACESVVRYDDADHDGHGDLAAPHEGCDPPGVDAADDCDDADPAVHPGAEEACDTTVDANCDGSVGYTDADGDGWAACDECDDADAAVHPEAVETCDGVDQDCDGATDEGAADARDWYADADGDGFGDPQAVDAACEAPPGFVDDATDCDDADAGTHPGAPEACDEVDADCDGSVEDADADGTATFWRDADGDGYGAGEGTAGCTPSPGWVAQDGDCDDVDPTLHPGAPESCDGVDEDCDGVVDDDPVDGIDAYPDADDDRFGDPAGALRACALPDGYVDEAGDCDDTDRDVNPEVRERCDGDDDDCDGDVDEEGADDESAWYRDADGDGYGDAAVSHRSCDAPPGYVADATDCDDADASVTDGRPWYADADGDGFGDPAALAWACDAPAGTVADASDCDDTDAAVTDGRAWYADADGDGYGDPAALAWACDAPSGTVADDADCDDARADIHPDAAEPDCADPTDYNCDGSIGADDVDGDGAIACDDCDDADPARHPGLEDDCDGVDTDCDGETDEDDPGSAWYADADGDGYGDPATEAWSCFAPAGFGEDGTDCDDADPRAYPGAPETCATPGDDDCDGDANDADALGCTTWYADADGDGYGAASACLCAAEGAYTATTDGDCDDTDASVVPGAVDTWGDGVDQDCDGYPDALLDTQADVRLDGEADADTAGECVAAAGDIDGDGYDDILVGATRNDDVDYNSGVAYLVRGPITTSGDLSSAYARLTGLGNMDYAGSAVAGLGDVDGDGLDEYAVGAYGDDSASREAGAVYIFSDGASGSVSSADATILGATYEEELGISLVPAGDVDGDGYADLLAGAAYADGATGDEGGVYLFRGPLTGTLSDTAADATLLGEASMGMAGHAVRSCDLDGDGTRDVLVGANEKGADKVGAVYIQLGPLSGTYDLALADRRVDGADAGDYFGSSLACADLDGDGGDDLVSSSPYAGGGGRVYVFTDFPGPDASWADTTIDATDDEGFGRSVADVPDVDGDGVRDLLVGAPYTHDGSWSYSGRARLFVGIGPGTLDASDAWFTLQGTADRDYIGWSVAEGGDLDADGTPDWLFGASGLGSFRGGAYVVYGR